MISFHKPEEIRYQLKGRMGVDSDWVVLRDNVPKHEAGKFLQKYKETWRHVKAERIS